MPTEAEIEDKFWKALKSDMTVMLGIEDHGEDLQPMTAQLEDDDRRGPIWFFTSKETDLVRDVTVVDVRYTVRPQVVEGAYDVRSGRVEAEEMAVR